MYGDTTVEIELVKKHLNVLVIGASHTGHASTYMDMAASLGADLNMLVLTGVMPGCLSYVVAEDPSDPDVLWITEAWVDVEAHAASLELSRVQEAIAKGRPLIVGMDRVAETTPVGGHGLMW